MKILQKIQGNRLSVYLIWQPVLQSDNRASAENRTREFSHEKLVHFWDRTRFTGRLWQRVLDRRDIPWDVYYLYDADVQWEEEPTRPNFWRRRLGGGNRSAFELRINKMLLQIQ